MVWNGGFDERSGQSLPAFLKAGKWQRLFLTGMTWEMHSGIFRDYGGFP